jgi:hypothetical protein
MSNLELFKGNPLASSDLFKSLMETNKKLQGGNAGGPRISIRGGRFRMIVGGEQVSVRKDDFLNVMVADASGINRTYYEGTYDPENPAPPKCWSVDGEKPAPEVDEDDRMAARCADCPMNVKGSGQGNSRACRFSQRLAVLLEGDESETVYQMQVPATSIFGAADGKNMPLQAYVKLLTAHDTPIQAVMTQVFFDENSETPKLFFKPERPLDETELNTVVAAKDSPEAKAAITMTVSQMDNVQPKKKVEAKPAPKATKKVEEEAEVEVEEPKKTAKKAAPAATAPSDVADILAEWDD